MKRPLAPVDGRIAQSSSADDSRARQVVVPTAMTRRCSAFARVIARATAGEIVTSSGSKRFSSTRAERTGRNVPGPTCSVMRWISTSRAPRGSRSAGREVKPRRGRRHRAVVRRVHRLVALPVFVARESFTTRQSPRPEEVGKLGEDTVLPASFPPMTDEQMRGISLIGRVLGDPVRRQVVVEEREIHVNQSLKPSRQPFKRRRLTVLLISPTLKPLLGFLPDKGKLTAR